MSPQNTDRHQNAATMGTPSTTTIVTIRVLLLRHGERQDETCDYNKRDHTRRERMDPALTARGTQQALEAWRAMGQFLSMSTTQRVMIACSPLRRCIGTALMVVEGTGIFSSHHQEDEIDDEQKMARVVVALPCRRDGDCQTNNNNNTIPILIMNGLADCAKQMQSLGGVANVVPNGWLHCAASPSNDIMSKMVAEEDPNQNAEKIVTGTQQITPFQQALSPMCETAVQVLWRKQTETAAQQGILAPTTEAFAFVPKRGTPSTVSIATSSSPSSQRGRAASSLLVNNNVSSNSSSPRIQFWRESTTNKAEGFPLPLVLEDLTKKVVDLLPMTGAKSLSEHAGATTSSYGDRNHPFNHPDRSDIKETNNTQGKQKETVLPMISNLSDQDEVYSQTLERAVLHAAQAGLETCILVTHREMIRFVEKHWAVHDPNESNHHRHGDNTSSNDATKATTTRTRTRGVTSQYCCVAVYNVTVDMQSTPRPRILEWHSRGVVPYHLLHTLLQP